jgi:hypothetical protein
LSGSDENIAKPLRQLWNSIKQSLQWHTLIRITPPDSYCNTVTMAKPNTTLNDVLLKNRTVSVKTTNLKSVRNIWGDQTPLFHMVSSPCRADPLLLEFPRCSTIGNNGVIVVPPDPTLLEFPRCSTIGSSSSHSAVVDGHWGRVPYHRNRWQLSQYLQE